MSTAAPSSTRRIARESTGFGGLTPSAAVARGGETLVAALAVEHYADGVVVPLLVLSEAPGLIEWRPRDGLVARDDRGGRYPASLVSGISSLGQLVCAVGLTPDFPTDAKRIELVIDNLMRVNASRGGGPGVARALSGGPWNLVIDLRPDRTVAEPPDEPADRRRPSASTSIPVRTVSAFEDLVPVGQVRLRERRAVSVFAIERYAERSVVTLGTLGPPDPSPAAPPIARATVDVWDDLGHRYRSTPIADAGSDTWSEVALSLTPCLDPAAGRLGIRISDLSAGEGSALREPLTFGVALPTA